MTKTLPAHIKAVHKAWGKRVRSMRLHGGALEGQVSEHAEYAVRRQRIHRLMTCGHVSKPYCEKCQHDTIVLEVLREKGAFTYGDYRNFIEPELEHIARSNKKLWVLYFMNTLAIFILGLVLGWLI